MIKNNKWKLIITSIVTLLPMLIGFFGGMILPDDIASRLDFAADGMGGVSVVFLILPAILLAIHWLCVLLTIKLDKNAEQNKDK